MCGFPGRAGRECAPVPARSVRDATARSHSDHCSLACSPSVQPRIVCRWTSLFVDRHEVAVLPGEEYEGWQAPRRDTKVGHATNKDFMITAVAYAVRLTFEVSEGTGNHRRSIAASFVRDAAPL